MSVERQTYGTVTTATCVPLAQVLTRRYLVETTWDYLPGKQDRVNGEGIGIYGTIGRPLSKASAKIKQMLIDRMQKGYSSTQPFSIGKVGKDVERFFAERGFEISTTDMYFGYSTITHSERLSKGYKRVSLTDMITFPMKKRYMHKYYDNQEGLIYTDYKNKFIVHPNREIKINRTKTKVAFLVTMGVVTDKSEFKNKGRYTKI